MDDHQGDRILVIEDDPTVSDVLGMYLRQAGYRVELATDGEAGLEAFRRDPPDLVILDLMLPKMTGADVCREIRCDGDVPIIMLTALGSDEDRIAGLELGADDYVTKPFSLREVTLRVASVLRRAIRADAAGRPLSSGSITLDPDTRTVTRDGKPLSLTLREFDLLAFFLRNPNRTFGRKELLEQVWGWNFGDQSTVTVHVRRVREKIELDPTNPSLISTVWGVGYRWTGE